MKLTYDHKYCCFDIGNVLARVDCSKFLSSLSKRGFIREGIASHFLTRTQKPHDLGYTSLDEALLDRFYDICDYEDREEWLKLWDEAIVPDPEVIDYLRVLDGAGFHIALLSNIGIEHATKLDILWKDEHWYQNAIRHYSYKVGARKPHSIYYQSFLLQYPQFQGALYLDDLQENLDAAKPFGFETLQFKLDSEKTLDLLQKVSNILWH